jgi:hypothetical protein
VKEDPVAYNVPPLPEYARRNFQTLMRACEHDDVCLVSAKERATGKTVALVAAAHLEPDGTVQLTPFAVMIDGNGFELYDPPATKGDPCA